MTKAVPGVTMIEKTSGSTHPTPKAAATPTRPEPR